jgi:two-component system, NtrC family, response regulator PilR
MPDKILFLDDRWRAENWNESFDRWVPDSIETIYEEHGYKAIQRLRENPEIKLVFLDLNFEGQPEQGEQILDKIKKHYPDLKVIILTSRNDTQLALRLTLTEKKAYYYFHKDDIDEDLLKKQIENAIETVNLRAEAIRKTDIGMIVGESSALREALRLTECASQVNSNVLITGESGTGKELIARSIHQNSHRKNMPFIAVNCGAIAQNLIESELFGHVRGAFTDAVTDKRGKFERAHKGTIFLDEIAELRLELQIPLLRVIQLGEFEKVGSEQVQKVDVRVIAATNQNLEQSVEEGTFRSDLFYRLDVIRIKMPSLRERREDIPQLAEYFLQHLNARLNRTKDIGPEAFEVLKRYDWPGNIRELQNVIERAIATSESEVIGPQSFRGLIAPDREVGNRSTIDYWIERVMNGQAEWDDIRKEFGPLGDARRQFLVGLISSLSQHLGRRPTGTDIANSLKITRNNWNAIASNLGLRLREL